MKMARSKNLYRLIPLLLGAALAAPRSGARGAVHPNGSRGFSSNEVLRVHSSPPSVSRNLMPGTGLPAKQLGVREWLTLKIFAPKANEHDKSHRPQCGGATSLEFSQQSLRFLLRQPSPNHLPRYLPLAIKLVAFGELAFIQVSKGISPSVHDILPGPRLCRCARLRHWKACETILSTKV